MGRKAAPLQPTPPSRPSPAPRDCASPCVPEDAGRDLSTLLPLPPPLPSQWVCTCTPYSLGLLMSWSTRWTTTLQRGHRSEALSHCGSTMSEAGRRGRDRWLSCSSCCVTCCCRYVCENLREHHHDRPMVLQSTLDSFSAWHPDEMIFRDAREGCNLSIESSCRFLLMSGRCGSLPTRYRMSSALPHSYRSLRCFSQHNFPTADTSCCQSETRQTIQGNVRV